MDDDPTNLGVYEKASTMARPKQSLLTDKSLTPEELKKLHENLTISLYAEPTNENKPYRPLLGRPLTREQLIRRIEQARDSTMLGMYPINTTRPET